MLTFWRTRANEDHFSGKKIELQTIMPRPSAGPSAGDQWMMVTPFDREAEEQFLNKPVILNVAQKITEYTQKAYSERHYSRLGVRLRTVWLPTEEFRASAYISKDGDHEIRLSYGSAIDIYRDAFVLSETCKRVLTEKVFDPIFDLLSYGNLRKDVLPKGLTPTDAKITIIRLMTGWLYLHEQAHLLQRYGDVAGEAGAALFSNDGEILDSKTDPTGGSAGRQAAVRHAFELAADYEATSSLIVGETAAGMSEADLWCFAAGLMCMFQRFYGGSSAAIDDSPIGTHPHPAVRMRMAMSKVESLFAIPEVAKTVGWANRPGHARAVMEHAVYTANVYWHLRYLGLKARTPFLDAVVAAQVVPKPYQDAIFEIWRELRPKIVKGHLGDGEPVVMFLKDSSSVG